MQAMPPAGVAVMLLVHHLASAAPVPVLAHLAPEVRDHAVLPTAEAIRFDLWRFQYRSQLPLGLVVGLLFPQFLLRLLLALGFGL